MTRDLERVVDALLGLESEAEPIVAPPAVMREANEVVEALGQCAPAIPPPPGLRDRVMASVELDVRTQQRFGGFFEVIANLVDLSIDRVRDILGRVEKVGDWTRGYTDGFFFDHFRAGPACAESYPGLVSMQPGVRFPLHRHTGKETVLVLEGGLEDLTFGSRSSPGDVVIMDAGSEHTYQSGPAGLLFMVILEKGIEITEAGYSAPQF